MNNITVAGPLGRDAELRSLNDGTPVLNFSVADSQGKEKPTIWWACQLFGKRATSLQQYLLKGQNVTVAGNVTQREYTDKDGVPRKAVEIRVADVALQGGSKREGAAPAPAAPKGDDGFDDSDLPF